MEKYASTGHVTALPNFEEERVYEEEKKMTDFAKKLILQREAEDVSSEETSPENGNTPHEVCTFQRPRNFMSEPLLAMAGIDTEVKKQGDRDTEENAEQEGEIDDHIAQPAGRVDGLKHGGSEFDVKEKQGLEAAGLLQESSTWDNDMQIDQPQLLPHDFFSAEETTQLASYLQRQAEKIGKRFQRYSSFRQSRKPSICVRNPCLVEEEEQPLLRSGRGFCTIPQEQSKVLSDSSKALPGQRSCLDLSLKLSQWLNAGRVGDSDTDQKRSSESCANPNLRSHLEPMVSEEFSEIASWPHFAASSAGFKEPNDGRWHENILHSSQEGADHCEHGNGLIIPRYQEAEDHGRGTSCGSTVEKWSPSQGSFSISTHVRPDIPVALNLGLCQQTCTMPICSELEHAQEEESLRLQVTPPSLSCVDSSECDNFGAEITTRTAADEPGLRNGRSRNRSEEIDAMSEAGELENCKQEETVLKLGVNSSQAPMELKRQGFGALDLLVTAIQVTSGEDFGVEEDGGPGPSKMIGSVIKADNHVHSGPEGVYFVHGRSPIVKKRVIRRARSAFKKQGGDITLQSVHRYEIHNVFPEVPCGKRRKKSPSDEKQQGQVREQHCNLHVPEAVQVKDGEPVIRSKRGRFQVLPTKFSDSVLQPWKRKSRGKHRDKLKIP